MKIIANIDAVNASIALLFLKNNINVIGTSGYEMLSSSSPFSAALESILFNLHGNMIIIVIKPMKRIPAKT